MLDSNTLDAAPTRTADEARPVARPPGREEAPREDGLPDHETRRLAHEIVARFVRDPVTFAATARVVDPAVFLQDYRAGVDRRLTALVGPPKRAPERLATFGATDVTWVPATTDDPNVLSPDAMPRMATVAAVAAAVTAVVQVVGLVVDLVTIAMSHVKPK